MTATRTNSRGGRQGSVPIVEILGDETLADGGELGGEVSQRVGRVDVLDDEVESELGLEADSDAAEDLDIGLQARTGGLLELHADRLGAAPPDDPLGVGDDISAPVALGEAQVEVAVLAT
jgi:hypothetical protein